MISLQISQQILIEISMLFRQQSEKENGENEQSA